jgi:hypothetical protein
VKELVATQTTVSQGLREEMIVGRKEGLDDLIAAFARRLHEENPNPERIGCPKWAALTGVAADLGPLGSDSILDHVRECAACLDELRDLRKSGRRS